MSSIVSESSRNKAGVVMVFSMALFLVLQPAMAHASDGETLNLRPMEVADSGALEIETMRNVIRDQLGAIKKRDAEQALSFTTRKYHEKFNDASGFLGMVRYEHRPIYNFKSYQFTTVKKVAGDTYLQHVTVSDRYGNEATAIYKLQKDTEAGWLIDSFMILDKGGMPI